MVNWFSVAGNGDAYLSYLCLFEGETLIWRGRLFHFLVFQPQDSICLSFTQTKKLSNETTTYFSINTQVCYDHVLIAWNFPLKLSSSTIFIGAESLTSDHVMSPNKLLSCAVTFMLPFWKIKVSYTTYLVRQGVKEGCLYEGEGRELKWTLSHYCACTKLRFSDRMLRIQKIHIVL